MIFNKHSNLQGEHAFLGASKYHWVNYNEDKLRRAYATRQATLRGTQLHELAAQLISLEVRLPDEPKTLNLYVNDSIEYGMTPEQPLFYSRNSFGTADAIAFDDDILRVNDLKTGAMEASFKQLEIYAALFCLEYDVSPNDIAMLLSIYQSNAVRRERVEADDIFHIMDKIVTFDRCIERMRLEDREKLA